MTYGDKLLSIILARFIRISAFLRKEIAIVLRQPRLLLTLVLGPFLILFFFGIGYREEAPVLRTLFVVEEGAVEQEYVEQYAGELGPQLVFAGITHDVSTAMAKLNYGEVDVVAVVPDNIYETVRGGEQVVFRTYHNEIMPTRASYINFTMGFYVDVANRRVLEAALRDIQAEASHAQEQLQVALKHFAELERALEEGDIDEAYRQLDELITAMDELTLTLGTVSRFLDEVQALADRPVETSEGERRELVDQLTQAREELRRLRQVELEEVDATAHELVRVGNELERLDQALTEVENLRPAVIVSPFRNETQNVMDIPLDTTVFYAPGVVALLIQHLCVTFAALSIVEEARMGTMELFEVSPLSDLEILLGKYLSYILSTALVSALLSLLLVWGLDVPMLGNWWDYAVALLGVVFASLSIGFLISLLSQSTSQAVQFSMIVLLASVFFTGFMQGLEYLRPAIRVISWSLPATYGIQLLQNIMLRGSGLNPLYIGGLLLIGAVLFLIDWFLLHRKMVNT